MHNVNWWLMTLAFLLGLLLTLAMMIRKVTREVPEGRTLTASATVPKVKIPEVTKAAGVAAATGLAAKKVAEKVEKVEKKVDTDVHKFGAKVDAKLDKVDAKLDKIDAKVDTKIGKVEKVVTEKAVKVEHVLEHDPYGKGSIRVTRGTAAPAGYTIKGDKDTGRYFTLDAPDYEAIEAEVWFANEESAEKADFIRWNAKAGEHHDTAADAVHFVVKGGTTTPDSAKIVVTGGGASSADTAKTVVTGGTTLPAGTAAVVHEAGSSAAASKVRVVSADDVPAGPHGRGTIKAYADGTGPAGWAIKGNEDSMLYHTVDSPNYDQTIAEVWFVDEETAKRAGFKRWDSNR
jgi:hypothetical protein